MFPVTPVGLKPAAAYGILGFDPSDPPQGPYYADNGDMWWLINGQWIKEPDGPAAPV